MKKSSVKIGNRVQWIGEDIHYFKKGHTYTVKDISFGNDEGGPWIYIDGTPNYPWTMVNFRLLNGLDLAKIAAQKSKRKKNDDQ